MVCRSGASGSSIRYAKLVPSIGDWAIPSIADWRVDPDQLEQRGQHVDRVGELRPDLALGSDATGPRDDARIRDPALVDFALPTTERCVAGHRPAPWVVVVRRGGADLVDASAELLATGRDAVPQARVVDRAQRAAFGGCTVVGHDHDDGVVAFAELLDEAQDASDLLVGVRQERGEALHEPSRDGLVGRIQRIPGGDPMGTRCERGGLGDDAERLLAREGRLAPCVPTAVEPASILVEPARGCVVGRVTRTGGEVQVEGLIGLDAADRADHRDRFVREVLGQVVPLLLGARRRNRGVVPKEIGDELVRLAAMEAVPVSEPTTARPRGARRGEMGLVLRCEMPLPDGHGCVAGGGEDLGQESVLARDHPVVAGEPDREVGDARHAVRMVVPTGQQAGPGG